MANLSEREHDLLLVVGTAPGTPEKLASAAARFGAFDVAAVNAGGLFWTGKLKLWCSYHYEHMKTFVFTRWAAKLPMDDITYVLDVPVDGLNAVIMTCPFNGSSGMLGMWAGLQMGYPRIVLVGIEMNAERVPVYRPAVLGSEGQNDQRYGHFRPAWEEFSKTPEAARVRSVAGWTSELLGKP